ncbi:hypothetical protein FRC08_004645 [Ceratobasidium sp. 394]|nr:hypothetical protein FRC08_004645 [Ceratobasidium sp. 394]
MSSPLKQAADGILASVEVFEYNQTAAKNREDYQTLRTELNTLFHDLAGYFGASTPPVMTSSIVNLAQGIERELGLIRQEWEQNRLGRYINAREGADKILQCYGRIKALLDRLTLNANINIWRTVDEQTTETRLKNLPNSPDAKYNSSEAGNLRRGECTQNTRVELLEELHDWACDDKSQRIYWLNGMAGTGKTTVAYSLCERLKGSRKLAASFFCSRQLPECRKVKHIVPTISYQLSLFSHPFRSALSQVLAANPDAHNQPLPDQFRQLILEPLDKIKESLPTDLIAVIDALDECEEDEGVGRILDVLLSHAQDLPLKFLVAGRPDAKILDRMRRPQGGHLPLELRLHELGRSTVQQDIRTFLATELGSRMTLSQDDLTTLVKRPGVLFIYAATVVRYIGGDNFSQAEERLQEVLDISRGSPSESEEEIDALYTAILKAAFGHPGVRKADRTKMKLVLDTIVCAQTPLSIGLIVSLLKFENESPVRTTLRHLRSVLQVSDTTHIVTTLHESFPDYLLSETRSNTFHCNAREQNARLAQLCFDQINVPNPPFNICDLESSYVFDKDVPDLPDRVNRAISEELFYACRYWDAHLRSAKESRGIASALFDFLSNRLLLWMEVMNLKERIYDGRGMLHQTQEWSRSAIWLDEDTKLLLRDAWIFTDSFALSPAMLSTPHIYVSVLSFWPADRPITKHYPQQQPHLVDKTGAAMSARGATPLAVINTGQTINSLAYSPDGAYIISGDGHGAIRTWDSRSGQSVGQSLKGHTFSVNSVAYSPDGAYIISGSSDKTIRIWDAYIGQTIGQPLKGHTGPVNLVAYSPDGAYIVSSSRDYTLRIWDARTGQSVGQPLQGHTDSVNSAAYSPDGAYIVSGSRDTTIRIWDAHTGRRVGQPLEGHTASVNSVAYSPDGAYIISGSHDNTIRIWDAYTGQSIGKPLKGHTSLVNSVAYSPDGAYIVSGSRDKTIRIWNAHAGQDQSIGQPLEGHTGSVTSVVYSPDGAYIISGSYDGTIRIWDACIGQSVGQPLRCHTNWVNLVVYSPDGAYIVSGSHDKTIRIWDARTGQSIGQPLEGHTRLVSSVAYSPDGAYIVSGSYDKTIRIWDAHTGRSIGWPLKGHTNSVRSVAYSPDGAYIVSGSSDKTIRIWNAYTGQCVGKPLKGHTNWVNSVAYSPDGAYIISGSSDKTIRIWDAYTGQTIGQPLESHTDSVNSVAYSPSGTYAVSGSCDKTVQIWDAHTGQSVGQPLEGHTDSVNSVAYLSAGAYIVSGSRDKTIRIWDAHTGRGVGQPLQGHTNSVTSVAYSPDGAYLASGSYDNAVRIWDMHSGITMDNKLVSGNNSAPTIAPSHSIPDTQYVEPHVCNPGCRINGPHIAWTLNDDGWVAIHESKLLVWVPPDLRGTLLFPQSTAIISTRGSLRLDFDHHRIGDYWQKHFQPVKSGRATTGMAV